MTPSSAATTRMTISVTLPTGAHAGERFVTGRVDEGNQITLVIDALSTEC